MIGYPSMQHVTVEGLKRESYIETIKELQRGLAQFDSMKRSEGQSHCTICEDNDHTAEQCWYHNPLLLALIGEHALLGMFWKCFHCGAVLTDEESAERHFGKTPVTAAECLRQLIESADLAVAERDQ